MISTALRGCALVPLALVLGLTVGCGPIEGYRLRTALRVDDSEVSRTERTVDLAPIVLSTGFRAGGQTTGEAVEDVKEDWTTISRRFDEELVDQSTPELRLVPGGRGSRYVLEPEIVLAASSGDVWFGWATEVGVLFTLRDRESARVVERFTVLGDVMGQWRVAGTSGAIAHSVIAHLNTLVKAPAVGGAPPKVRPTMPDTRTPARAVPMPSTAQMIVELETAVARVVRACAPNPALEGTCEVKTEEAKLAIADARAATDRVRSAELPLDAAKAFLTFSSMLEAVSADRVAGRPVTLSKIGALTKALKDVQSAVIKAEP